MAALDSWPGKRYAITTWMSVPALASGARALARMPVLFSTSFLHNTILFTVTAIMNPSFSSQNSLAIFLGGILLRSYEGCNTTNSIQLDLRQDCVDRGAWVTHGATNGATLSLKILSCSISSFIGQIKTR